MARRDYHLSRRHNKKNDDVEKKKEEEEEKKKEEEEEKEKREEKADDGDDIKPDEEYPWEDWDDWEDNEEGGEGECCKNCHHEWDDWRCFGPYKGNEQRYICAYILVGIVVLMNALHLYIMIGPSEFWADFNPFMIVGSIMHLIGGVAYFCLEFDEPIYMRDQAWIRHVNNAVTYIVLVIYSLMIMFECYLLWFTNDSIMTLYAAW
jgi:hypothetical protein